MSSTSETVFPLCSFTASEAWAHCTVLPIKLELRFDNKGFEFIIMVSRICHAIDKNDLVELSFEKEMLTLSRKSENVTIFPIIYFPGNGLYALEHTQLTVSNRRNTVGVSPSTRPFVIFPHRFRVLAGTEHPMGIFLFSWKLHEKCNKIFEKNTIEGLQIYVKKV